MFPAVHPTARLLHMSFHKFPSGALAGAFLLLEVGCNRLGKQLKTTWTSILRFCLSTWSCAFFFYLIPNLRGVRYYVVRFGSKMLSTHTCGTVNSPNSLTFNSTYVFSLITTKSSIRWKLVERKTPVEKSCCWMYNREQHSGEAYLQSVEK